MRGSTGSWQNGELTKQQKWEMQQQQQSIGRRSILSFSFFLFTGDSLAAVTTLPHTLPYKCCQLIVFAEDTNTFTWPFHRFFLFFFLHSAIPYHWHRSPQVTTTAALFCLFIYLFVIWNSAKWHHCCCRFHSFSQSQSQFVMPNLERQKKLQILPALRKYYSAEAAARADMASQW